VAGEEARVIQEIGIQTGGPDMGKIFTILATISKIFARNIY